MGDVLYSTGYTCSWVMCRSIVKVGYHLKSTVKHHVNISCKTVICWLNLMQYTITFGAQVHGKELEKERERERRVEPRTALASFLASCRVAVLQP